MRNEPTQVEAADPNLIPLWAGDSRSRAPFGYHRNIGTDFVPFPITLPGGATYQAEFVKVIMDSDPMVHGVCRGSSKTFIKPLYATASYSYTTRPHYREEDLFIFGQARAQSTDQALVSEGDTTLRAEVQRFRALEHEIERVEVKIRELEDVMGNMIGLRHGTVRRLEMADAIHRIKERVGSRLYYGNPWDASAVRRHREDNSSSRRGRRA
jgi:hypothetical protein